MTCITTPSYTTHHSTQSINTLCTTQQYIIHCTSTTQCHHTLRITVHYALTMSLKKMNFDLNLTAPSPEVDHKFINPKCESVHACIFSSFFLLVCPLPPSPPPPTQYNDSCVKSYHGNTSDTRPTTWSWEIALIAFLCLCPSPDINIF